MGQLHFDLTITAKSKNQEMIDTILSMRLDCKYPDWKAKNIELNESHFTNYIYLGYDLLEITVDRNFVWMGEFQLILKDGTEPITDIKNYEPDFENSNYDLDDEWIYIFPLKDLKYVCYRLFSNVDMGRPNHNV